MPTKNPRIHVVLGTSLFKDLKILAKRNGLSLSLEARELISEALKSTGRRAPKIYNGKHFGALIGKYRLGLLDLNEELVKQAHG